MTSQRWLDTLRASGYRITAPRRAVVDVVTESSRALTPAEVHARGRRRHGSLGLVSVYRTLERLEQLGLTQRVHLPGGCHAYMAAAEGHQHLVVCEDCGSAVFFSGDDLEPLIERVETASGFHVNEHWLQLLGTCAACQTE